MIMDSWMWLLAIASLLAFAMGIWRRMPRLKVRHILAIDEGMNEKDPYSLITPLPDFDWRNTEPLKLRPFKPKFHLTMGLVKSNISELVDMDKTYLSRVTLRRQIMRDHRPTVLQAAPSIKPAVDELYTWLISVYLPTRFPTMFTLTATSLVNHATSEFVQLTPPSDPIKAIEILGANIDDDFLLLLPSEDGDGYVLKGFVTCFPAGFDTREKFGLKLRDIHKPVPGYKEKLEKSMDRFFDKIEVGNVVLRANWSIATHDRLYAASGGHHLYEGDDVEKEIIDINNTWLRVERQILHRLPQTKALVFSFKTFLYPLKEIKDENLGEALAQAIDGLKEGSVPQMNFYKRGVVWGEEVKKYLRS